MSNGRGYGRCIECEGEVEGVPFSYAPRLISFNGYFFKSSWVEREKACSICGLVHNFDVDSMRSKKTLGDVIKALRLDPDFRSLSYEEKGAVLRKARKCWNDHYKDIDRRKEVSDLLNFVLQNTD